MPFHATMMRRPARIAKRYFDGDGTGEGPGVAGGAVGVGASIFRTSPAGVRSASIGVVSGVGGAGAVVSGLA